MSCAVVLPPWLGLGACVVAQIKNSLLFQGKYNQFLFSLVAHRVYIWILLHVAFCTIMAISRQKETRSRDYSYFEWLQGFFIVHSTIGSTVHSMPLNSLVHCICTTTMTNIRPGFETGTSRLQAPVDTNEPSGPAKCALPLWPLIARSSPNAGLMLGHRLRRWPSISPALGSTSRVYWVARGWVSSIIT